MKHARFLKAASGAAMIVLMSTAALAATNTNNNMTGKNTVTAASQPADVSHMTKKFIKDAWQGNVLEIETSQRALDKSKNAAVLKFADQMVRDHKDAEAKFEDCLKQENLAGLMPTDLDGGHKRKIEKLMKDDIKDIDSDYVDIQVDAHNDAVDLFKDYAEKGDDPALKSLAGSLLPTLQEHQRMAKDLKDNYKKSGTASNAPAVNNIEPAAGADMRANDVTNPGNTNPNTDHPNTNANTTGDGNTNEVPTANPTEGKSSPSGGPPY
jgi:putative membrane protein